MIEEEDSIRITIFDKIVFDVWCYMLCLMFNFMDTFDVWCYMLCLIFDVILCCVWCYMLCLTFNFMDTFDKLWASFFDKIMGIFFDKIMGIICVNFRFFLFCFYSRKWCILLRWNMWRSNHKQHTTNHKQPTTNSQPQGWRRSWTS